jgi:TolC family type I secretion outer membrane protein
MSMRSPAAFRPSLVFSLPLAAMGLVLACLPAGAHARDPFDTLRGVAPPLPCAAADAGPTSALSLTDVVNLALCANPQTREVWANARAQAAQVGVAQAAWLPTLDASAGIGRSRSNSVDADTRKLGLTASWLLYDFGARSATIENARQLLEASNATRDATLQTIFLNAVQAFYQVQGAQAALEAARVSEQAAERSLKSAQARYAAGAATPADALQAQTAFSQAQLTRITADGTLKTALGTLALVLGRDAQRPLTIAPAPQLLPPGSFEQDVDALVTAARKRRPDLLAAGAQIKAAEASVDAARAGYLPSLSLGFTAADQKTEALPDSRSGSLGLTLNIPLFAGFATNYKVQSAQAQLEARHAQAERIRIQVAQDVWNAAQSLVTATQSARTTADLLASAEQSDRVARGRYASGVGTLLEMLNAQSALATARQQRVQALYNWNVARVTLAQAMGDLAPAYVDSLNESSVK